ncbi:MAG: tripartite tricarboxylate transporter substrate-binding protein [Xanthobacteraceae bacterium]
MVLIRSCTLALALIAMACGLAYGEDHFPSRVITIVVPITPGTAMDIQARLFAQGLSQRYGYQVIVENKPGAGTLIGAETVAKAAPDGYTILFTNSAHAILGTMNKNLPFDPVADFSGICLTGQTPAVVTVASSLGVHTLREFVQLAKAKPGTINYGSAGIGTATHLAGAYFAYKTGTSMVHVPYTVTQNIITDLLAGNIQVTFSPAAFTQSMLQNGRLIGLAVGADTPLHDPVQIPTAVSQGVDYVFSTWYGFLAPAKTPRSVLQTLHDSVVEVAKEPAIASKIRVQGITPADIGLGDFDAYIRNDMARLSPLLATIAQAKQ